MDLRRLSVEIHGDTHENHPEIALDTLNWDDHAGEQQQKGFGKGKAQPPREVQPSLGESPH